MALIVQHAINGTATSIEADLAMSEVRQLFLAIVSQHMRQTWADGRHVIEQPFMHAV